MNAKIVQRRYEYVRVDLLSVVVYPVLTIALFVIAGKVLLALGLVKSVYASPFVVISALMANRVCLRAGLVAATLSVLVHEFFFSAPYHELNLPTAEQAFAYLSNFVVAWAVARKIPIDPYRRPAPSLQSLPFTCSDDTRIDRRFWVVDSTDDWPDDCHLGSEYGRIYLDHLSAGYAPPLGWIIRDMIKAGRYTGVEAGFSAALGHAAAGGAGPSWRPLSIPTDDDPDHIER